MWCGFNYTPGLQNPLIYTSRLLHSNSTTLPGASFILRWVTLPDHQIHNNKQQRRKDVPQKKTLQKPLRLFQEVLQVYKAFVAVWYGASQYISVCISLAPPAFILGRTAQLSDSNCKEPSPNYRLFVYPTSFPPLFPYADFMGDIFFLPFHIQKFTKTLKLHWERDCVFHSLNTIALEWFTYKHTNGWLNGWKISEWREGRRNEWINEQMNEWKSEWMIDGTF